MSCSLSQDRQALSRFLEPFRDVGRRRRWGRVTVLGRRPPQGEAGDLAGRDRERRGNRRVGHGQRNPGAQGHPAAAAEGPRAAGVVEAHERLYQPVLRARGQLHPQLHLSGNPLDAAKELVRGIQADVVAALAVAERHCVGEGHLARLGGEGGLQYERPGEIAPLGRVRAGWADRPVARVRVEQPRENRVAVVAGEAEPVDRAAAVNERGGVAVGQQPVRGHGLGLAAGFHSADHGRTQCPRSRP
jgi:hypothetical protein